MSQTPHIQIRKLPGLQSTLAKEQRQKIFEAHTEALRISKAILADFQSIWQIEDSNLHAQRKQTWKNHPNFPKFLGGDNLTPEEIRAMDKRMHTIIDRLQNGLHLVVIQRQEKTNVLPKATTYPCKKNRNAYAWWPRRIYLCSRWFGHSLTHRAAILIHEIVHQFGPFGQGHHGALTQKEAIALAISDPLKARKSPENYEALAKTY